MNTIDRTRRRAGRRRARAGLFGIACLALVSCSEGRLLDDLSAVDTTGRPPIIDTKEDMLRTVDATVAAQTRSALDNAGIQNWIDRAHAAATAAQLSCDPAAVMLRAEQFQAAVSLADEVTGELIADLDASLGAAAEWCRRGDLEAARIELRDASLADQLLQRRLRALGR